MLHSISKLVSLNQYLTQDPRSLTCSVSSAGPCYEISFLGEEPLRRIQETWFFFNCLVNVACCNKALNGVRIQA